jgi:HAD superfamily hydrolase (TIGR01458 family)
VAAARRLSEAAFPHLFLTNSTLHPKSWILQSLAEAGFTIPPDRVLTAAEAAGAYLAGRGHSRVGWLCVPSLVEDLPDLEVVDPRGDDPDPVDAVVVGDMGDGFTYAVLNRAFCWLHDGAELVAVGRNRTYQADAGLVLDSGPFVALLEFAAETRAAVTGKPSPAFFAAGLARLGTPPAATAMIGDDLEADVHPAMDLGLLGVLVRTGKYREDRYRAAARPADRVEPDFAAAVDRILGDRLP